MATMTESNNFPRPCLTIAGSDPSGGAGIQGDLKTFAAHGVYGMAVITALTAQNSTAVTGILGIEADFVRKQLEAIYDDIPAGFVKTGMLFNREIVATIAEFYASRRDVSLVVDPVMISSSGAQLLNDDAVKAYVDKLFPLCELLTPNNQETRFLSGVEVRSIDDAVRASQLICDRGARNVLVKGGDTKFVDSETCLYDVLNLSGKIHVFEREIVGAQNSHGTGCAMAASICSYLAGGKSLVDAVDLAGRYVGEALRTAYPTGKGTGSINHLWNVCSKNAVESDDISPSGIS